jgi:hypothetical protein
MPLHEIWKILSQSYEKDQFVITLDLSEGKIYPICGSHHFTIYDIEINDYTKSDEFLEKEYIYLVNNEISIYISHNKAKNKIFLHLEAYGENNNLYYEYKIIERNGAHLFSKTPKLLITHIRKIM